VPQDDDLTARLQGWMALCATLGVRATAIDAAGVTLELDWRPELCTSADLLHGGVIMALADSAGGACAMHNLPAGASTATIESKTNFLRGVTGGTITATATPLHVGRATIVVETEVRDDTGRLVAKVTQTQAVLGPR
jgi:1,4-dihydroxy-2-naphthoyl-CoA hydrolase